MTSLWTLTSQQLKTSFYVLHPDGFLLEVSSTRIRRRTSLHAAQFPWAWACREACQQFKRPIRFFSANVMRTAVTIHLGYSLGKGRMHGHYNAGGILFGNYRVPQQSGPRQNSLWQGFHSNQDPDRILFGKGSTAIRTQTEFSLARVPQQSGPRQNSLWQGFHSNQDPDRILFGKGSTAISTQTGLFLARVQQQSGPRQDCFWQGFHNNQHPDRIVFGKGSTTICTQTGLFLARFHSNQHPDRIVFGKGSTTIRTQTGLFLARVPQQSGPRRNSVCNSSTRIKIQTGFAYREQYPDRILTGKGYTGINIQTGFWLVRVTQESISRQDSDG